jgi:peptidoglycan/LPS O-acetylase OafA/YrhL
MLVWAPTALLSVYALLSFERVFSRHVPPLLQLLGDSSYSIYLAHLVLAFAFLHAVLSLFPGLRTTLGFGGVSALRIVLACGFGILVHKIIELPLLDYLSTRIAHPKRAPQVLAVPSQP